MDKIWLKNYEPGVPEFIDSTEYSSLVTYAEECFHQFADKPCFSNFGTTLTFRQIDEMSQAFAGSFAKHLSAQQG
jgi:long-chain acyl-CoA synthetase